MHFVDAKGLLSAGGGMNIYRGCSHGCIYCDSRSVCYGMKHEFEDIEVKRNAPALLEEALRHKRKKCMIATGAMCDPYLPCEETLGLTRRCLEIIARNGFGATVLTKSDLVLRDLDLFRKINEKAKCVVQMTVTTHDEALCHIIEPHVTATAGRVAALRQLRDAGIPTVVWLTPLLPFINDTEENLRAILDDCFSVGVVGILCFGIGVTLREGDREYFYAALDRHFPGMKERYIARYGNAYEVTSDKSPRLMELLRGECRRRGVMFRQDEIFSYLREFPTAPEPEQISFF